MVRIGAFGFLWKQDSALSPSKPRDLPFSVVRNAPYKIPKQREGDWILQIQKNNEISIYLGSG